MKQPVFNIKDDTTVGDLKRFLAEIPDDANICMSKNIVNINIRFRDVKADCYSDSDTHKLYIEQI